MLQFLLGNIERVQSRITGNNQNQVNEQLNRWLTNHPSLQNQAIRFANNLGRGIGPLRRATNLDDRSLRDQLNELTARYLQLRIPTTSEITTWFQSIQQFWSGHATVRDFGSVGVLYEGNTSSIGQIFNLNTRGVTTIEPSATRNLHNAYNRYQRQHNLPLLEDRPITVIREYNGSAAKPNYRSLRNVKYSISRNRRESYRIRRTYTKHIGNYRSKRINRRPGTKRVRNRRAR